MSITLPTFQELYDLAKDEVISKDTVLKDFNEGSALDVHAGISSIVGTELIYQLSRIIKAFYVQTAGGEDLDNRLRDFSIIRKAASAASGILTLTRAKYNLSEVISANTTFKCEDGTEFYNEDQIVFAAGQQTKTVTVIAKIPGGTGNILANQIKIISPTTITGITITHPEFNNGIDGETDAELRDRFYLELSSMPRGTKPALVAGALRFNGVSAASTQLVHSGYTKLYIDSGTGTPSAELINQIQTEIDANWRAAGEKVEVVTADTISVDVTVKVLIDLTYIESTSEIIEAVKTAISKLFQTKLMSESIYRSEMIDVVMDITGIIDCEVLVPTTNITGQASKIIRAGVITVVTD